MSKGNVHKTNVMRMLDQRKIHYEMTEFPWSEDHLDAETAAEKLGVLAEEVYKTLVTIGKQTGPVVAVIPANQEVDLKKLAKASGNKKIEMLHMKDLEQTTGYIRGGCSPVGMKKLYPTFIGKEAEEMSAIYVSAGQRGRQIKVAPLDLAKMVRASFAEISIEKDSGARGTNPQNS